MGFVSGLLAVLALVFLGVAIAGLIQPSWFKNDRTGEVPSRKDIAGGAAVLAVLLLIGSCATKPDKATPNSHDKLATENASRAEIMALWRKIGEAGKPCDEQRKTVEDALSKNDRYEAYDRAQAAQNICREAYTEITRMDLPSGLSDEVEDAIEKALDTCRDAYFIRQSAYGSMSKVINGDERPSAVSEARDWMSASQGGILQCAAKFMGAAAQAGIKPEAFASDDKKDG